MTEASVSTETTRREEDLEKGDHQPSQNGDLEETVAPISESESHTEGSLNGNLKDESLSRTATGATPDDDDPFSLYPRLSLSISSTQGAFSRRNTAITLTHPLTREETRNTLKSVRSRFTEVRSEFDENVPHIAMVEINDRTISRNLLRLMKT